MCGGDIQAIEGQVHGMCDSCGTNSTLPKASDERIVNLFNRANQQRQKSDFDKAMANYENILNEDATNAEAHWGVVLCRYGIEYVEDPRTHERIPTCHRVQYESILSDNDYLAALENAPDNYARELYEYEAKKISEIQKGILAISNTEEPYDVFICYKETTDGGSRTKDSALAQDIYYQLEKEGYKTFFARITLEGKLGQQYEPYIFAALNSAKVMLVIGTDPAYFNAVWVRNEWSRFLLLMKKDRSKLLIPCYKDMDAYDIPNELSMFQSQDMGKIGFIQDLIHGIKKVIAKPNAEEMKSTVSGMSPAFVAAGAGIDGLLKRAFIFLEDGDFKQAGEYCDRVLDIDPENARAYVGLLCIELKVKKEEELQNYPHHFNDNSYFQKAIRYADEVYKQTLTTYVEERSRNERFRIATEKSNNISQYGEAAQILESLRGFKNADEMIQTMENTLKEFALSALNDADVRHKYNAVTLLNPVGAFAKANNYVTQLTEQINAEVLKTMTEARELAGNPKHLTQAIDLITPFTEIHEQATTFKNELVKDHENWLKKMAKKRRRRIVARVFLLVFLVISIFMFFSETSGYMFYHLGKYKTAQMIFTVRAKITDSNWELEKAEASQYAEIVSKSETVKMGYYTLFGLKSNGTVIKSKSLNKNDRIYEYDISKFKNINTIDYCEYNSFIAGLKDDGTVILSSLYSPNSDVSWLDKESEYIILDWSDIIEISAGNGVYGLKSDGTVVGYPEHLVSGWHDIVSIAAGSDHIVGLKRDGTVIAASDRNSYGECDTMGWTDVIAIEAGNGFTVGLKTDGTVIAAGCNKYGQLDVNDWKDIIEITVGSGWHYCTVGLKADGTVVMAGQNRHGEFNNISDWENIVSISLAGYNTIRYMKNGKWKATGSNFLWCCSQVKCSLINR